MVNIVLLDKSFENFNTTFYEPSSPEALLHLMLIKTTQRKTHMYPCFCSQLCFAYRGMLKNEIGVVFNYRMANGKINATTIKIPFTFSQSDT